MRTIHRGATALATLALAGVAGCSGTAAPAAPPAAPPAASPSAPVPVAAPPITEALPTTTTPPPPPGPPRDGTNISACRDGDCQVTIRSRQTVTVRGSQGSVTLRIAPLPPDGLSVETQDGGRFEASGSGSTLSLAEGIVITDVPASDGSVVITMTRS